LNWGQASPWVNRLVRMKSIDKKFNRRQQLFVMLKTPYRLQLGQKLQF